MKHSEVMQRVVGTLVQSMDWHRQLAEDVDREIDTSHEVVTQMLSEAIPAIQIRGDASAEAVAAIISREIGASMTRLVSMFTLAFLHLAQVHDDGRTDVSAADVLKELGIRAAAGEFD